MQVLTLDVGGSAIKYGVCDEHANITHKGEEVTPTGPQATVHDLVAVIKQIHDKIKAQGVDLSGIAIGIPGCVNKDGSLRTAGALIYNIGQPVAQLVEQAIGMRPAIENDAKAAAAAELWCGSLQGISTGAILLLGTGLGGGIVVDGHVHQGPTGAAGELSSFMLNTANMADHSQCGAVVLSTTGLQVAACEALGLKYHFDDAKCIRDFPINGRQIFDLYHEGNEAIIQIIEKFGEQAGRLIFNMGVVLDLERVAIGGGISAQPCLVEAIDRGTKKAFATGPNGNPKSQLIHCPEVVACKFHNDANLIGVMYHFMVNNKLI